jgi:hypothetical protein
MFDDVAIYMAHIENQFKIISLAGLKRYILETFTDIGFR